MKFYFSNSLWMSETQLGWNGDSRFTGANWSKKAKEEEEEELQGWTYMHMTWGDFKILRKLNGLGHIPLMIYKYLPHI